MSAGLKANSDGTTGAIQLNGTDVAQITSAGIIAPNIHAANIKTTPVGNDEFGVWDYASGLLNRLSWTNFLASLRATANVWTQPQTFSADTSLISVNGGQLAGFRNRIINGGMQVSQRGTSFVNCLNTYTIDRWRPYGGPCNITISQTTQPYTVCTSGYGMRFSRTAGETLTNNIGVHYSMETKDSWGLVNKTVTLSFRCQKGANFSSSGNLLNFSIISGTGTDEKSVSYTGSVSINGSAAVTGTPATYTLTGTIPTTATEVGVSFNYSPTGTAGANDYVDICDVQLEIGSVATPFEQRPYGTELALCQRYLPVISTSTNQLAAVGQATSGTAFVACLIFPVQARVAPTGVAVNSSMANFNATNPNGTASVACSSLLFHTAGLNNGSLVGNIASGLTAGNATGLWCNTASTISFLGCEL